MFVVIKHALSLNCIVFLIFLNKNDKYSCLTYFNIALLSDVLKSEKYIWYIVILYNNIFRIT